MEAQANAAKLLKKYQDDYFLILIHNNSREQWHVGGPGSTMLRSSNSFRDRESGSIIYIYIGRGRGVAKFS